MAKDINEKINDMSDFLSLGIKTVDLQHEKFFKMLDELRLYSANKDNKLLIENLLEEFSAYATYHFVAEERMMKKSEFPLYEVHMQQHLFFKQKLDEFKQALEYKNEMVDEQMLNFLRKWFVVHISEQDKQYADYIKLRRKK